MFIMFLFVTIYKWLETGVINSSELIDISNFVLVLLVITSIITLFFMLYKWLVIKNIKYELTTERLKTKSGILDKITDELELYRIKDYILEEPFHLRLFKLSNIKLNTSDKTNSITILLAIKTGKELLEKIRFYTEEARQAKGVKEFDLQ